MIELKKESEKVLLVGVGLPGQDDIEDSLKELSELAATAGAQTVGQVIQSREQIHPEPMSEKERLMKSKTCCGSLTQQVLFVMMNSRRYR